jgi:hypothetical protein
MYFTDSQLAKIREIIKPLSGIVGDENHILEAVKQSLRGPDLPSGITLIHVGRNYGKINFANALRDLGVLGKSIIIDDIDEPLRTVKEFEDSQKNYKHWIETYFPRYASSNNNYSISHKPEIQNIKLGVKKRYTKAPRIESLTGRQYFELQFKLTDNLNKTIMRKKKYPNRPTLKAESIFDTEKRLRHEAKEISQKFIHIKPIKFLLK